MEKLLASLAILIRIVLCMLLFGFLLLLSRVDSRGELAFLQILDILGGIFVAGTASRIDTFVFDRREGNRKWRSWAVYFVSWLVFSGSMAAFHEAIARARWHVPPRVFAMTSLAMSRSAIQNYMRDCGDYPLPDSELALLMMNPGIESWSGPYIDRDEMKDPWGTPIRCDVEPLRILVRSAGPDRIFDTPDDLTMDVKS